jgi:DUF4097 and DUF4098 domain-containing protein YvlB
MQVSRISWEMIVAGVVLTTAAAIISDRNRVNKPHHQDVDKYAFEVPEPPEPPDAPTSAYTFQAGPRKVVIHCGDAQTAEALQAKIDMKRAKIMEKLAKLESAGVHLNTDDLNIRVADGNVLVLGAFDSTLGTLIGQEVAMAMSAVASAPVPPPPPGVPSSSPLERAKAALASVKTKAMGASFEQAMGDFQPSFTADGKNIVKVKLSTSGGNVRVTESEDANVYIQVKPSRSGVSEEEVARFYDISMKNAGGEIEVKVEHKARQISSWETRFGMDVIAKVPRGKEIDGLTAGGNMEVRKYNGSLTLETHGGNIVLAEVTGITKAETKGGNLVLNEVSGKLDVLTRGGNIEMTDVNAEMKMHTNGGNLRLSEITGKIQASTNGGNIRANISEISAPCDFSTNAGNIELTLPETCNADLDLRGMSVSLPSHSAFKGNVSKDRAQGQWNRGGPKVKAVTSVGRVSVAM